MSQPESGRPYAIINKKSGTAIDLSGEDNRSIIGYKYHEGDNQKWVLSQEYSDSWEIRSFSSEKFIGILGIPIPGARAIGLPVLAPWRIILVEDDPEYFQISFPGTDLFLTLSNDGSSDDGTPVLLQPYSGGENQMWKFQDV